ncbi:CPBP family intramembrane glutamic endopeptidase [Clostridium sp. B9]|uniref:CPBP family intramembrane glutamic endopeptidase n=1 Tax=Clostridium sp. B9 TaxID=3423224 RepID=UPI003D2EA90E
MTSSRIRLLKLIRNFIVLFIIFKATEPLAHIIFIPIDNLLNKILPSNLSKESYDNLKHIFLMFTYQIFSIFVFYIVYRLKGYNRIKRRIKLNLKTFIQFAIITFGSTILSAIWIVLVLILSKFFAVFRNSLNALNSSFSFLNENIYLTFISAVILAPIMEELFFRGIVFNEASKYKKGAFPIIVSGLLFGLVHMHPIQIVYASIFGIILGLVYNKTHSLTITIFMHMLANLSGLAQGNLKFFLCLFPGICFFPMISLLKNLYKPQKNGQSYKNNLQN